MSEAKEEKTVAESSESAPPSETTPSARRSAPPLPAGKQFIWGTGRRKSAIARVRIRPGDGKFMVNKLEANDYFKHAHEKKAILLPLETLGMRKTVDVFVNVKGGGPTGQAGAVSLGLARALADLMPDMEHDLRGKGLLTRDARMKERKKPGQPGARKHFQFSKR